MLVHAEIIYIFQPVILFINSQFVNLFMEICVLYVYGICV